MTSASAFHFESLVWDWPIAIYLFLLFSLITGNIQNLFTISSIPAYDAFIV